MREGYVYFAETSTPFIKVGRFFRHVTLAQKEACYRRLDPGFRIRHAYLCDDVVAEEKRVLTMLRLVGGTDVTGAGRECFKLSVADAVVSAAVVSPDAQLGVARKLVMDHRMADRTVRELISDVNANGLKNFTTALLALSKIGIALTTGGRSLGAADEAFATVVNELKLKKSIPSLKSMDVPLTGLALY